MEDGLEKVLTKNLFTIINEIPIPCQIIVDEGGKCKVKDFRKVWINKAAMAIFSKDVLGNYGPKESKSMINSLQAQWEQVKHANDEGSSGFVGPFTNYFIKPDNSIIIHEYHILFLGKIEGGYNTFLRVTTNSYTPSTTNKSDGHIEAPNPWEMLSIRERHIAELTCQGMGTKAIAEKLCISERTVDNHRSNIRKKLNIPRNKTIAAYLSKAPSQKR